VLKILHMQEALSATGKESAVQSLTLVKISKPGTAREFTANEVVDFSRDDFPTMFPRAGSYIWYRLPGPKNH